MASFQMLLFLLFLHLIKYSQRNVNMSHYDYFFFFFPIFLLNFSFIYLCFFAVMCLMLGVFVVMMSILCELYLLSLKYSSLFHLK